MRILILLYPWIELWSLIQLGVETSALFAVLWVFVMFMLGGALLRRAGMASMTRLREAQASGVLRQQVLLDDMSTGFAALLFIIPGLVSDFLAVLVLIGPLRRALARWLTGGARGGRGQPRGPESSSATPHRSTPQRPVTLEGDYDRVDDPDSPDS